MRASPLLRQLSRKPRLLSVVTSAAMLAALAMFTAGPTQAAGSVHPAGAAPLAASQLTTDTNAPCNVTPKPDHASCMAIVRTTASHDIAAAVEADGPPSGSLGPAAIQSAYHLPATGSGQTVGIVDAYGDSNAESDLAAFRSYYGLPPCTTANGCFRKVDQTGGTNYPPDDAGWALETSLDLDAVSSACPACSILLVEGNSDGISDLAAAENEAAALGAKFISNSYGTTEDPSLLAYDSAYQHAGVAITVSSGDTGNIVEWPSSNPDVTAVGGTTLTKDASSARGWDETAWSQGGSGCSQIEPQPAYQVNLTTDCTMRAVVDVAADADPQSGLGIYDTLGYGGWLQVGGTSLASPLIASVYALAGTPTAGTYPVNYPYHDPTQSQDLFDITEGSDGACGNLLCNAGTGWDGPTGVGTPDGVSAFTAGPEGQITGQVTDASTGQPVSGATVTASPGQYATVTDSNGDYTLVDVTAGTYTVTAAKYAYQTGTSSGVQVPANGSGTASFSLTELPHATVSGTITDGSGHGWPIYAKITIGGGYPGGPVYTNPFTGSYSVVLAAPGTYPVQVTAAAPAVTGQAGDGYQELATQLAVGTGTATQNFSLQADLTACTALGYGPEGLSENFSGWTGGTPGPGWTVSGTRAGWRFDDPGDRPAPGNQEPGSGQFAIADSGMSHGRVHTTLTSPAVDLSGQSAPVVRFTSGYYGGPGQRAQVSLSTNGRAWRTIWQQGAGDVVGPVSIPVPQAAGQSQVRVRFSYTGNHAWWWSVGGVLIGTPGCAALPGGLVTGLVTDRGTGQPVNGATVTSARTGSALTSGAGDPAVPGGLYQLFSPAGSQSLTVSADGYGSQSATVDIAAGQLTRQDWALTPAQARRARLTRAVSQVSRSAPVARTAPGQPAAPDRPAAVALPWLRAHSYTVTLITGDQVRLAAAPGGRYSASVIPSPGSGPGLRLFGAGSSKGLTGLRALPLSATSLALISSGQVNEGLFDVAWLASHGDTGPAARLPVVLRYGGNPDAATLARRAGVLPGATVTAVSAVSATAQVSVTAGHAAEFWAAITGRPAGQAAAAPALADGITGVWLAGHQVDPDAQPAAAGQALYTVTETIQGSSDPSQWCTPTIALCTDPSIEMLLSGITGEGEGQSYPPITWSCIESNGDCTGYQVTYSVPAGVYMGYGLGTFYNGNGPQTQSVDLMNPQITVAGNTGFSMNMNAAKPVTVSTPRPAIAYSELVTDYRGAPDGTYQFGVSGLVYQSTYAWYIPSSQVTLGSYDFNTSWQLQQPGITASVDSPRPLSLHPFYWSPNEVPSSGQDQFSGNQTLPVVFAGTGSAQDFSSIDVRGKIAFIDLDTADQCVLDPAELQNALQAGAAGVLVSTVAPVPVAHGGACPLPVYPQWVYADGGSPVNIPFAELPAAESVALQGLLARGPVTVTLTNNLASYRYELSFASSSRTPASADYALISRDLTAVQSTYHSPQPAAIYPSDTAIQPDESVLLELLPVAGFVAPSSLTEYYGPQSPAAVWDDVSTLATSNTTVNTTWAFDLFSHGGATISHDWFGAPAVPGVPAEPGIIPQAQPAAYPYLVACSFCRQGGNDVYPVYYEVEGPDPAMVDGPELPASDIIHLYQNGQEIPLGSNDGIPVYQLSPQQASYLLTLADNNTSTQWTFSSGQPQTSQVPPGYACVDNELGSTTPCAALPLIFLRYNAFASLSNTVSAGATHIIQVTPYYQAPDAPARVTSLKLWISTDGGSSWQQEHVQYRDGTYTARYYVPALSATSGSVSIKVQAADSAGDTVTQTVTNAYTISS